MPQWNTSFRLPRLALMGAGLWAVLANFGTLLRYSESGQFLINIKLLAHMASMSKILRDDTSARVVVFDQGVIFEYASLTIIGLPRAPARCHAEIFEAYVAPYCANLCLLCYLYADRGTLEQRILDRETDHRLKHFSETSRGLFFRSYSETYEAVIERMEPAKHKLLRFDTSQHSTQMIQQDLRSAFSEMFSDNLQ